MAPPPQQMYTAPESTCDEIVWDECIPLNVILGGVMSFERAQIS